jgi:hypothetical protein
MHERVLLEPGDFVLHVQFFTLQFRNFEAVDRRMRQRFGDFQFKGVVPSLEFRKMRFDRHVACLLALMDAASPDQNAFTIYDAAMILRFRRSGRPLSALSPTANATVPDLSGINQDAIIGFRPAGPQWCPAAKPQSIGATKAT